MKKEVIRYIKESELNEYEKQHGLLSYYNLFYKDENCLLCNDIVKDFEDFDIISGEDYNEEEDYYEEIYQYYLINEEVANRLSKLNEIIYYDNRLNLYVLGVTHFGMSWAYELTDVKIEKNNDSDIYTCYIESEEDED